VDASTLATAIKDTKEKMKDVFLRNMSKHAAMMLEEDMEKHALITPPC
jgi:flagellar motor switch protein FliG